MDSPEILPYKPRSSGEDHNKATLPIALEPHQSEAIKGYLTVILPRIEAGPDSPATALLEKFKSYQVDPEKPDEKKIFDLTKDEIEQTKRLLKDAPANNRQLLDSIIDELETQQQNQTLKYKILNLWRRIKG